MNVIGDFATGVQLGTSVSFDGRSPPFVGVREVRRRFIEIERSRALGGGSNCDGSCG